ncbi:hypothetical protein [Lysobacter sp. HA35]
MQTTHSPLPGRPLLLASFLMLAAVPMAAQAVTPLDTFSARFGGYIKQFDTQVRADNATVQGSEVDLDRDLDLGQGNAIAYINMSWRPLDNHEFGIGYYQDDTSASRQLSRTIEFDGNTYQANAVVHAENAIDAYEAYYVWWAANNPNWSLGPRLGLTWYRIDLTLEIERDAAGAPVTNHSRGEVSADLPVPTLGGAWRWVPGGDSAWRFGADGGWFSLNSSGLDGDVYFARVGVEWFPWERWGFSADYTSRRVKIDADKSSFTGNLNFRDSGVRIGVVYRF